MKRSRVPTLFFVIFLMIFTPLTPMASATEGRAEIMFASVTWENRVSEISVTDYASDAQDITGNYTKIWHELSYNQQINGMDPSEKGIFYNQYKDKTLLWMDTHQINSSSNWGYYNGDIRAYDGNSSNFCLYDSFNTGNGDAPSPGHQSDSSPYFYSWCENSSVDSFSVDTMPTIELDLENAVVGTHYRVNWWLIDCPSNTTVTDGYLEWIASSTEWEYSMAFREYLTGDYFIEVALTNLDTGSVLTTFDTACTGPPPGNSGGNNPPTSGPTISSHAVYPPHPQTGLHIGKTQVTNLTANTAYNYDQYLYPAIVTANSSICDQSGGHLHHEDASLYVGGAYNGNPIMLEDFLIGSNDPFAYPVELQYGQYYCYDIVFEEAAQDSNAYTGSQTIFSPASGFSGCDSNEWCWDNQKSIGNGFSYSTDGEYISYYDDPESTTSGSGSGSSIMNIGIPPGKWYWEFEIQVDGSNEMWNIIGVHTGSAALAPMGLGTDVNGWGLDDAGHSYHNEVQNPTSGIDPLTNWSHDDFRNIGIALDNEAGNMWYSIDGQWIAPTGTSNLEPSTGAIPIFGEDSNGNLAAWDSEYGSNGLANTTVYPAVTDSSNNRGHTYRILTSGEVEYSVPSGFTALPSNGFTSGPLDSDGDGLPDSWEDSFNDISSTSPDTDGDGIGDDVEDMDGDGLSNFEEYELGTNPNEIDTDGDGLTDGPTDSDAP